MLTVLREANAPLEFDAIARRVREKTDIRDGTLSLMLLSSPFVQLGEDAYGLIERDVPGGPEAIARVYASERCRCTVSSQRPNLKPTARCVPTSAKPSFSCSRIDGRFAESPTTAMISR